MSVASGTASSTLKTFFLGLDVPTTFAFPSVTLSTLTAASLSLRFNLVASAALVLRAVTSFSTLVDSFCCSTTRLSISALASGLKFFSIHCNVALVLTPPVPANLAFSEVGVPFCARNLGVFSAISKAIAVKASAGRLNLLRYV